jgi:hypothetical protein
VLFPAPVPVPFPVPVPVPPPVFPVPVPPVVGDAPPPLGAVGAGVIGAAPPPLVELLGVVPVVAVVLVVSVVLVVAVLLCAGSCAESFGGTSAGAASGCEWALGLLEPHAATATASRMPVSAVSARIAATRLILRGERRHTPRAVGTVVEILLGKLIAPIAEPQVLYGPWQVRG